MAEVQTTERTSKGLKLHVLLSSALTVAGIALAFLVWLTATREAGGGLGLTARFGIGAGLVMAVAVVIWRVVTKVRVWWHHG